LSINEEKLVATVCQLVVCFGIHYNLDDNIGVSIDKLSKYGVNIKLQRAQIESNVQQKRLERVLQCLYEIKCNKREHVDLMSGYFYRKYLHELVCSLIQLTCSPDSGISNEPLKNWLEIDLFEDCQGSALISALLMSQSSSTSMSWFSLKIGQLLTRCLLRPNSVLNVVKAILNEMSAVSNVSIESDWKKCVLVAQIVARCPLDMSAEEYVRFIAPQLLDLYFKFDLKYLKHFHRVAGSIYSVFARRWPQLTFSYITKPIIQPLIRKEITNKEFIATLARLNLVYVLSNLPNCFATLQQLPVRLVYLLFEVYAHVFKKPNAHKTKIVIEDLLKLYVKLMPDDQVNTLMIGMLKNGVVDENNKLEFNFDMFQDDTEEETTEFILIKSTDQCQPVSIQRVESKCRALASLIKSLRDDQLEIGFLLHLFQELSHLIRVQAAEASTAGNETNAAANDQTFVHLENKLTNIGREINAKIILFTQISILFEFIDSQLIVDKHEKIIDFCEFLLRNILKLIAANISLDESERDNELELIHMILSLISVFTTGVVEINYEIKKKLLVLKPLLIELKVAYAGTDIESMADSLTVSIGTLGGVVGEKVELNKGPLIEELNNDDESDDDIDDYSRAMRDLNDPLMPVKAHGLVVLRKLIESKNEKCQLNKNNLIDIFMKYLKNDDSYVYLAAVQGLISLVDQDPSRVLDLLLEQYLLAADRLDVLNRLKVGEVLTKTVRNFNELVPKYGPTLLSAFLVGCKHNDDLFRASSLSNLGETCKLLNYSLGDNLNEIINCLSSIIDTDKSMEAKRSASMVLKMIIEGLRRDNFLHVLGSSITPLYKLLVRVKSTSQDDVIRLNCQLTSDYLNELVKESMFPKKTLQKEIRILRP
jgi:hypothetical protein